LCKRGVERNLVEGDDLGLFEIFPSKVRHENNGYIPGGEGQLWNMVSCQESLQIMRDKRCGIPVAFGKNLEASSKEDDYTHDKCYWGGVN